MPLFVNKVMRLFFLSAEALFQSVLLDMLYNNFLKVQLLVNGIWFVKIDHS